MLLFLNYILILYEVILIIFHQPPRRGGLIENTETSDRQLITVL
jgi:hypothetical protein